jgi:hypothetical protein
MLLNVELVAGFEGGVEDVTAQVIYKRKQNNTSTQRPRSYHHHTCSTRLYHATTARMPCSWKPEADVPYSDESRAQQSLHPARSVHQSSPSSLSNLRGPTTFQKPSSGATSPPKKPLTRRLCTDDIFLPSGARLVATRNCGPSGFFKHMVGPALPRTLHFRPAPRHFLPLSAPPTIYPSPLGGFGSFVPTHTRQFPQPRSPNPQPPEADCARLEPWTLEKYPEQIWPKRRKIPTFFLL